MASEEIGTILLVDDRPENLLALDKLFKTHHLKTMSASSGNEALGLVLKHDFALILMDVQMPEMDGFETAEIIRGNKESSHIPIIFITAINKEQKHVFKGYESGAVDYIFKPFDSDILLSKVRVFLELNRQKTALARANEELEQANRTIIKQQKAVIEEERLKVLLQMAGATAHELNQPLMALLASIELLTIEDNVPENISTLIIAIKDAGERIADTVRKIQNLQKPETKTYMPGTQIINFDQKLIILSIEDSTPDFEDIRSFIADEKSVELLRAPDIEGAFSIMENKEVDLIFLDHILPDGTGFDFLLKAEQKNIMTPVVVITGQGDEILASKLIQAGAYDYLPKRELGKETLNRVIHNVLEKAKLKGEIRRSQAQLAKMSTTDELTGLFNRRYFNEAFQREIERADRYGIDFSLCLMDLDHFKLVNDTHGHHTGDSVLKETATLIQNKFRKTDLICRFGGEEFAVIFPHTSIDNAAKACDAFREALSDHTIFHGLKEIKVTISIGIISFGSSKITDGKQLLKLVDQALYQAKTSGRNRIIIHKDKVGEGNE